MTSKGTVAEWDNPLIRLCWWSAGVYPRVMLLPQCEADRLKHALVGMGVVLTVILAAFNGHHAASVVYGEGPFAWLISLLGSAFFAAWIAVLEATIMWGVIKEPDGRGRVSVAVVWRYLVSFVIATTMAVLAVMHICEDEIEVQMRMRGAETVAAFDAANQSAQREIDRLAEENRALSAAVEKARDRAARLDSAARCELDGTCGSGIPDSGRVYKVKKAAADSATAEWRRVQRDAEQRTAENVRALAELRRGAGIARDSLAIEVARARGLLPRYLALRQLKNDPKLGTAATVIDWGVTLFFWVLEMGAVSAKMSLRRGPYEAEFRRMQDRRAARADARRDRDVSAEKARAEAESKVEGAAVAAIQGRVTEEFEHRLNTALGSSSVQAELAVLDAPIGRWVRGVLGRHLGAGAARLGKDLTRDGRPNYAEMSSDPGVIRLRPSGDEYEPRSGASPNGAGFG